MENQEVENPEKIEKSRDGKTGEMKNRREGMGSDGKPRDGNAEVMEKQGRKENLEDNGISVDFTGNLHSIMAAIENSARVKLQMLFEA